MTDTSISPGLAASRLRLWVELLLLFVGVPILMAVYFEEIQRNRLLFGMIWALAIVAWILLRQTPGWDWRDLFRGPVFSEWRLILGFSFLTTISALIFVFAVRPEIFLHLPRYNIGVWLMVMTFYPLFSAWPQELIYRTLFFERYEGLFPNQTVLIIANGALFGFGHLFYENWITITMTGVGGAIIGWAYLCGRSTTLAWVLHALAGQIIFTSGLGIYFYSGMVGNL